MPRFRTWVAALLLTCVYFGWRLHSLRYESVPDAQVDTVSELQHQKSLIRETTTLAAQAQPAPDRSDHLAAYTPVTPSRLEDDRKGQASVPHAPSNDQAVAAAAADANAAAAEDAETAEAAGVEPPSPPAGPIVPTRPGAWRILAIGDLHGDWMHAIKSLRTAGVIDAKHNWIAGDATFVQTGDIVDRGDDTIRLYELMRKLTQQARAAGGEVRQLLGNHEVMNMEGDLRYVTPGDVAKAGGDEARRLLWSKQGWIGQYLRELNITTMVHGHVFVHGGVNVDWAKQGLDVINMLGRVLLQAEQQFMFDHSMLHDPHGPLWYRGYALDPEPVACRNVEEALGYLGAKRIVMGHTPQLETGKILSRCDGRILIIDIGISQVYGGHTGAVEITPTTVEAIYVGGRQRLIEDGV